MFNPHLETNFELNPWKLIINDFFPYESKRSFWLCPSNEGNNPRCLKTGCDPAVTWSWWFCHRNRLRMWMLIWPADGYPQIDFSVLTSGLKSMWSQYNYGISVLISKMPRILLALPEKPHPWIKPHWIPSRLSLAGGAKLCSLDMFDLGTMSRQSSTGLGQLHGAGLGPKRWMKKCQIWVENSTGDCATWSWKVFSDA